jgi:chloramphenicol-sensitive protein RarD
MVYGVVAYSFWGLIPAYYKILAGVSSAEIVAHRALWSAVLGILLLIGFRRLRDFLRVWRTPRLLGLLFVGGLLISSNWLVFLWAVIHDQMIETSMGYFINPLFSVLLGVLLLRERLRPGQIAAIALAAMGVVYLMAAHGTVPWVSVFLPITFGFYGFIRRFTVVDALSGITVETTFMLPVALAYVIWLGVRGDGHFGPGAGMNTVYLLLVGPITLLPLSLFGAAARRVRLTTLGILQYLSPTFTFLLGLFVYHEPFDRMKLVAFCCIWASLFIYTLEGVRFRRLGAPRARAGVVAE